jgi:hypothetical protein
VSAVSTSVLVVGFALMTVLAVHGRWMAAVGGTGMLLGGVMLFQLFRLRREYVAGLGLLWLGVGVAGFVLFLWGWF